MSKMAESGSGSRIVALVTQELDRIAITARGLAERDLAEVLTQRSRSTEG